MKLTNEYLRAQGLDVSFAFTQAVSRDIVVIRRRRRYCKAFLDSLSQSLGNGYTAGSNYSVYSIGRFKFTDLRAALLNPVMDVETRGHRSMGWQRYHDGWRYGIFATDMDFTLPQFTAEQVDAVMANILLDKLTG